MLNVLVFAALAVGVEPVPVDVHAGDTLHVVCPAGATSTIQLPEIGFLSVAAGGADRLGIKVESLQEMLLKITPNVKAGDSTRLGFKGARSKDTLTIDLEAGNATVAPIDVRYRWASAATPEPRPTPPPTVAPSATAPRVDLTKTANVPAPTPKPAATGPGEFRLDELIMGAEPESVGERQGLPGHRICVLEDFIEGAHYRWYRFRVAGGSGTSVRGAEGPVGPITTFRSEAMGKDLRIVVQVDRTQLEKKHQLKIDLSDGSDYSFELRNPSLGRLVGKIF